MKIILVISIILFLSSSVFAIDFNYGQYYGQKLYRNSLLKSGCFNSTVSLTPSFAFYTTGSTGTQPVNGTHNLTWEIYNNQDCTSLIYNETYRDSIIDGFLNATAKNMTIIIPKIILNMTDLNNSISNLGVNVGFNSTFNQTYHDYSYNHTTVTNISLVTNYGSFWYNHTLTTNATMFLVYGAQWYNHTIITNQTIFNTYNTYWRDDTNETSFVNNISSPNCPGGTLVIGVQANGSLECAADSDTVSTFNATYAGINTTANILVLLSTAFNWTTLNINNITGLSTFANITYQRLLDVNTTIDQRAVRRTDWTTIDNYPVDCSAGNLVIGLGDTLTCAADDDNPDTDAEVPDDITANWSRLITSNASTGYNLTVNNFYSNNWTNISNLGDGQILDNIASNWLKLINADSTTATGYNLSINQLELASNVKHTSWNMTWNGTCLLTYISGVLAMANCQ